MYFLGNSFTIWILSISLICCCSHTSEYNSCSCDWNVWVMTFPVVTRSCEEKLFTESFSDRGINTQEGDRSPHGALSWPPAWLNQLYAASIKESVNSRDMYSLQDRAENKFWDDIWKVPRCTWWNGEHCAEGPQSALAAQWSLCVSVSPPASLSLRLQLIPPLVTLLTGVHSQKEWGVSDGLFSPTPASWLALNFPHKMVLRCLIPNCLSTGITSMINRKTEKYKNSSDANCLRCQTAFHTFYSYLIESKF